MAPKAVSYATRLCQLSNRQDKNGLDTLADAYAENGQFDLAVTTQQKAQGTPPDKDMLARLDLYKHHQPSRRISLSISQSAVAAFTITPAKPVA
jgi:hypothetical protein